MIISLLKTDIKLFLRKKWVYIFVFCFMIGIIFWDYINKTYTVDTTYNRSVSFGTFWLYIFGGMGIYRPSLTNPFLFPALWTLLIILFHFTSYGLLHEQLETVGKSLLLITGRTKFWIEKILFFVIIIFLIYVSVFLLSLTLFAFVFPDAISLSVNSIAMDIFRDVDWIVDPSTVNISWELFIMPLFVLETTTLFQLVLSLWIRPVFSFMCIVSLYICSAYFFSPFLIGNYAMPVRNTIICANGVSSVVGTIMCVLLSLFFVFVGLIRFCNFDFLVKPDK